MNKQGFSSIISVLERQPSTVAEIKKKTGLAKSTIHHHLDNLLNLKFVSKEKSLYELDIPSEFAVIILGHLVPDALGNGKTLDELARKLIDDAKQHGANDTLKIFCKKRPRKLQIVDVDSTDNKQKKPAKELLDKLSELLKIFRSQGVVIFSSSTYQGSIYRLSWKGCMKLNICHVCKKKIDFKEKNFVMQSVESVLPMETNTGSGNADWIIQNTPIIHVQCLRHTSGLRRQSIPKEAVCYHCGLPLSKKLLHDWYFGTSELNILLNLLTKEESSNLYHLRDLVYAEQLREKFWGIDFISAIISDTGNFEKEFVNVSFGVTLATKLVEESKNKIEPNKVPAPEEDDVSWKGIGSITGNVVSQLIRLEYDLRRYSNEPDHKYGLFGVEIKPIVATEVFKVPNLSAVNHLLSRIGEGVVNRQGLKRIPIQNIFEITKNDTSETEYNKMQYCRTLEQHRIENAFDVFELGEEGMGKIFNDERIGSIVFSELKFKMSEIDKQFGIFFDKISTRAKELFEEWKKEHLVRLEKFDRAASDLSTGGHQLGASAYEIHSELTSLPPQPSYKDDASNTTFSGYSEKTRGYSFIQIDVLGNRYHPLCYDIQFPDDAREPKEVYDGSDSVVEPIKNEKEAKNVE